MQATLDGPGKPLDQFEALAFQLVVPVLGPTQLSVQAGCATAGVAVATISPIEEMDPMAMVSAATDLRTIHMAATSKSFRRNE
jgi:hypothetical protein